MNAATGCRIGIDVGGTFTDFVLADRARGRLVRYKEPSVPDDPSLSVERGIPPLIARAGVRPQDVALVVHGTTLALNAIIQRRGARLGLVVSKGNRGVLEIGRAQMPSAFSFLLQKEPPLVPRSLVLEVSSRLDHRGTILSEDQPGEIEAIAESFAAAGVASVTVMLLHAYANPDLEAALAEKLRRRLPGVAVSSSAAIWPERREYERCLVALMNAYVEPMMTDYLGKLSQRIAGLGIAAPVYITSNNGGTLSIATARARPIDTILSGPASGVVAAAAVARETAHRNLITVDMGGTSADMSVIQDLEPAQTTRTHVGGLPIIVPVVAVTAIGAGGGSVVWVDPQGVLKVGPHSAGAAPGPACYGRGGTQATVTDCYVVLGYVDPDHFLGGRLPLDRAAAMASLEAVAERLGIAGEDRAALAAESALRITTAVMSSEIARDLAQKGDDPRDYALMAFGGAGPTHAVHLAEDAGIGTVIVPATPSTFCALGAILADVKRDFVVSRFLRLGDGRPALDELVACYARLQAMATEWIASEGSLLGETRFEAVADARYAGQAFDLPIRVSDAQRVQPDATELEELFHRAHERIYSFRDPDSRVELTAQRLRVIGTLPPISLPRVSAGGAAPSAGSRAVFLAGEHRPAQLHRRDLLPQNTEIAGPAIVEQEDTTTIILPGWTARIDPIGNIVITRDADRPDAQSADAHSGASVAR